jgi:hypothetical protein
MPFHEFAEVFSLEEDNLGALADDIWENGQSDPIVTYEGKILDGRRRYRACLKLQIEPSFEEYKGDAPAAFVISKNRHRRHSSASQLAYAVRTLAAKVREEARKRQLSGKGADGSGGRGRRKGQNLGEGIPRGIGSEQKGKPTEEVAKVGGRTRDLVRARYGVNGKYIEALDKIEEKAPHELLAIRDGKKTIPQVLREVRQSDTAQPPGKVGVTSKLPKAVARAISGLSVQTFGVIRAEGADLARWASEQSWNQLGKLLAAVAAPECVLLVGCTLQNTLPETIGGFALLGWLILEAKEWHNDQFNLDVGHALLGVYITENMGMVPRIRIKSLVKTSDLSEEIARWFPEQAKLVLFGEEAPKGWSTIERPRFTDRAREVEAEVSAPEPTPLDGSQHEPVPQVVNPAEAEVGCDDKRASEESKDGPAALLEQSCKANNTIEARRKRRRGGGAASTRVSKAGAARGERIVRRPRASSEAQKIQFLNRHKKAIRAAGDDRYALLQQLAGKMKEAGLYSQRSSIGDIVALLPRFVTRLGIDV